MKKHYVSLETAKMLREKGYDIRYLFIAPELNEVQQWFREEHNIHIEIGLENFTDGYIWQYQLLEIGNDVSELSGDGEYKSYEQALEEGIINALKMM